MQPSARSIKRAEQRAYRKNVRKLGGNPGSATSTVRVGNGMLTVTTEIKGHTSLTDALRFGQIEGVYLPQE